MIHFKELLEKIQSKVTSDWYTLSLEDGTELMTNLKMIDDMTVFAW